MIWKLLNQIENNTWARGDMEFISECSHECEHECEFCLLYKDTHDDVIDYFPKISEHLPKISEDFPKFVRRPDERFGTFSEHFPKITDDFRRFPKVVKEKPIMF